MEPLNRLEIKQEAKGIKYIICIGNLVLCIHMSCPLQLGAISLAIKHYWVYHNIIVNGHSVALVLEDDVSPCGSVAGSALADALRLIVTSLPDVWDIILLGTARFGHPSFCPASAPHAQSFVEVRRNRCHALASVLSKQSSCMLHIVVTIMIYKVTILECYCSQTV